MAPLQPLSLASLLLQSLALSIVSTVQYNYVVVQLTIFTNISATVQRSSPRVSDRHIHTLAQIRPPMLHDYSPHAKVLGNKRRDTRNMATAIILN